jgi:3-phenylpropionate/trans-cinnamate dioxygenase ferredoxin subunit
MVKTKIGNVDEFEEGHKKVITLDWKSVLIVKRDGRIYALEGRCSHMGISLEKGTILDETIRCPVHGAIFDLATGRRLQNMQAKDIKSYLVTQEGNELFIDL